MRGLGADGPGIHDGPDRHPRTGQELRKPRGQESTPALHHGGTRCDRTRTCDPTGLLRRLHEPEGGISGVHVHHHGGRGQRVLAAHPPGQNTNRGGAPLPQVALLGGQGPGDGGEGVIERNTVGCVHDPPDRAVPVDDPGDLHVPAAAFRLGPFHGDRGIGLHDPPINVLEDPLPRPDLHRPGELPIQPLHRLHAQHGGPVGDVNHLPPPQLPAQEGLPQPREPEAHIQHVGDPLQRRTGGDPEDPGDLGGEELPHPGGARVTGKDHALHALEHRFLINLVEFGGLRHSHHRGDLGGAGMAIRLIKRGKSLRHTPGNHLEHTYDYIAPHPHIESMFDNRSITSSQVWTAVSVVSTRPARRASRSAQPTSGRTKPVEPGRDEGAVRVETTPHPKSQNPPKFPRHAHEVSTGFRVDFRLL